MEAQSYHAIGLMSGTSLDGLDLCYCEFTLVNKKWTFQIIKAETYHYTPTLQQQLKNAVNLSSEELLAFNSEYGFYLGEEVKKFIDKHQIINIDVIASHGHTVFHQPEKKYTLQIGDGRAIQILNPFDVVYDFRSQDVLMGGQGAPLVPIGDQLLFSDYEACINLGGFSNISISKNNQRIAFDICPVNIVLNQLCKNLGKEYDDEGKIAQSGSVNNYLLEKLDTLDFYEKEFPKSLGYEWIEVEIKPILENSDLSNEDLIATFTRHAINQISKILNKYNIKNVLFTGGGTHNKFLIKQIKANTNTDIIIPNDYIINYKEALIFAFMGILKKLGYNNVLSSATGSLYDHSTGIFLKS